MAIKNSDETLPKEWRARLQLSRFVGARLADACLMILRERKKITHEELVDALNVGGFRFRTTSPAREIHAALLRQPKNVERLDEGGWKWIGGDAEQSVLPLRLVRSPDAVQA